MFLITWAKSGKAREVGRWVGGGNCQVPWVAEVVLRLRYSRSGDGRRRWRQSWASGSREQIRSSHSLGMNENWSQWGRRRARPVTAGEDLTEDLLLASLLDTLETVTGKKAGSDGRGQQVAGRGRAADGTSGRGEWWGRRHEAQVADIGVQRKQKGRLLLDEDGGLLVDWLWRGDRCQ